MNGKRDAGGRWGIERGDWRLLLATVPLLVAAILYQPLNELGLRLGSITVEPIDVPLLLALGVGLPAGLRQWRSYWCTPETVAVAAVALVFLVPIFVGLAAGHDWQSVFRDARLLLAYCCFFTILPLITGTRQIAVLLWIVFGLIVAAAVFGAIARIVGIEWANGMSLVPTKKGDLSRGFGWWSAMPWYPLGVVIGAAFVALGDNRSVKRVFVLALSAFLLGSSLATLVRSQFVGVVVGVICVLALLLLMRRDVGWRGLALRGTLVVAVLALGGAGFAWLLSPPSFEALGERTVSIVSTGASSSGAGTNRDLRLVAVEGSAGFANGHPFGAGYGRPTSGVGMQDYIQSYWSSHSGLAWPIYRLGWVGLGLSAVAAGIVLVSVFRGVIRPAPGSGVSTVWLTAGTLGCILALLGESVGASYPFAQMYTYPLVPVLLALAVFDARRRAGSSVGRVILGVARVTAVAAAVVVLLVSATYALASADRAEALVRRVVGGPSATVVADRTAPGPYGSVGRLPWDYAPATPRYWELREAGPAGNFVWLAGDGTYEVSAVVWGGSDGDQSPAVQLAIDGVPVGEPRTVSASFSIERWTVTARAGRRFVGFEMKTFGSRFSYVSIADPRVTATGGAPAPTVVAPASR